MIYTRYKNNAVARDERGITMHDDWQYQVCGILLVTILPRTAATLDDRCDNFEMRGVEGQ